MGRRARFRGVKRTNKRLENDILERSKNLWENPSILRPKCAGNCRKCAFDKTFKKIGKLDLAEQILNRAKELQKK